MRGVQFLTDHQGQKTAAIVDLKEPSGTLRFSQAKNYSNAYGVGVLRRRVSNGSKP